MPKENDFTLLPAKIWFEAELWLPGSWNPSDTNTDVQVTLSDGSRWTATFFTYANIHSLRQKNLQGGECLSGAYFWASDMILVDIVSRSRLTDVIEHLLETGEFAQIFLRIVDSIDP